MPRNLQNLVGQKFGKLIVTHLLAKRVGKRKDVAYTCLCDCGKTKSGVIRNNLIHGRTSSCGCLTKTPPNKIHDRVIAIKSNLYSNMKCNGRNNRKGFSLSFEEFLALINGNCFYCGCAPSNKKTDFGSKGKISDTIIYYNGIDRINNNLGYEVNNCVPCCKKCNFCKGSLPQDVFLKIVRDIYFHLWKS